jgi:hypothetical protein
MPGAGKPMADKERLRTLYKYVLSIEARFCAESFGYDHEVAAELAGVRDEMHRLWPESKAELSDD